MVARGFEPLESGATLLHLPSFFSSARRAVEPGGSVFLRPPGGGEDLRAGFTTQGLKSLATIARPPGDSREEKKQKLGYARSAQSHGQARPSVTRGLVRTLSCLERT
jgi:hypothetical protein